MICNEDYYSGEEMSGHLVSLCHYCHPQISIEKPLLNPKNGQKRTSTVHASSRYYYRYLRPHALKEHVLYATWIHSTESAPQSTLVMSSPVMSIVRPIEDTVLFTPPHW